MSSPALQEVRLTAFKSFRRAKMPIGAVTVLTGRNNSGKSNALDGIEVLSRLASGEELADALDGRRREGGPVRGGSRGCAPHGLTYFILGCSVALNRRTYSLNVKVQVEPELRIVSEQLRGPAPAVASGEVATRDLLWTRTPDADDTGIWAEIYNGKQGPNPSAHYRDTRLLTSQLLARMAPKTRTDRAVQRGAEAVTSALRGVFHLDPIPHLMRDYVPERDADLRRTGQNLSAAIARLSVSDTDAFARLSRVIREVAGEPIRDLEFTRSPLGDVMLALREGRKRHQLTPAREMSDGLLRFIAITTALLSATRGLDIDPGMAAASEGISAGVLLVIEELESGLHPSQAVRVLDLVQDVSRETSARVALTTHSPALLNALTGRLNDSVLVCYRNEESGHSDLTRLTQLPGYAEAMTSGRIGDVVSIGRLMRPEEPEDDFSEFNRVLGIS